jgi:hypothetical protein
LGTIRKAHARTEHGSVEAVRALHRCLNADTNSHQLDEAPDLLAAFECFDERDEGTIDAGELRYWLGEVGDRMSDDEVRQKGRSQALRTMLTARSDRPATVGSIHGPRRPQVRLQGL